METGNEIKSAVKNMRYYANNILKLAKLQVDKDLEIARKLGINLEPGGARFNSLFTIMNATEWMDTYCDNILACVRHAEEQDNILRLPEEKKEGE